MDIDPLIPSAGLVADLVASLTKAAKPKKTPVPKKTTPKMKLKEHEAESNKKDESEEETDVRPDKLPVVWELAGGHGARREDGTLRVLPMLEEHVDVTDVQAMFSSAGEFSWAAEWRRGEAVGRSFAFDGTCCMCNKKVHDNQYYVFWDATGTRRLSTHSNLFKSCASIARGVRVPFSHRTLTAYQRRMAEVLDASTCRVDAHELPDVQSTVRRMLSSAMGAAPIGVDAAWYDEDADAFYVRLVLGTFLLVRVDQARTVQLIHT